MLRQVASGWVKGRVFFDRGFPGFERQALIMASGAVAVFFEDSRQKRVVGALFRRLEMSIGGHVSF